jgi:fermentation-respiration switch protein FrsA (DUF1100 family)
MTGTWKLLLYAVCIYGALAAFVYFRQSSLIYYPNTPGRDLDATPAHIGLGYEDVELIAEHDIKLHGWFIPNETAKGTVLFFHGNAGNISHRLESIQIFHRLGLDVFIIDYRGYGQSEGKATETGTYRDAEAAWHYLVKTRGTNAQQTVIFGRSLGASIGAWLASQYAPAALIVESGFASVPSMARRLYPFLPVRWLTHFEYGTKKYVENITCPVLVVHSRDDEIIPFEEGREIFAAAVEGRQFLEISGGHNDGFITSGSIYIEGPRSFIYANLR